MESILYLVHRMPYPPDKGDKIRSFHLLKHLSQRYRVYLGTFIDDPEDWQHTSVVDQYCEEACYIGLKPLLGRLRSLQAFGKGCALSLEYYRNTELQRWVNRLLKEKSISKILVFSSPMAQYAECAVHATRVIDFVDVDSDKWSQYAANKLWPMNWMYRHEAKALLRYERQIAQSFDASLFVSASEAALFQRLAPESTEKVGYCTNGVDTDYFHPAHVFESPYPVDAKVIVFTGAMDYWPNIDAVKWFASEVFPVLRKLHPRVFFYIVGSRPSKQVQTLAENTDGIVVTGRVPDVRPYLSHANVAVAPLRIARGIQNKVLEAMAMAKTVVVSPQALEGIDAIPDKELLVAHNGQRFFTLISEALGTSCLTVGEAARRCVESKYGWEASLGRLDILMQGRNPALTATDEPAHKVNVLEPMEG